VTDDVVLEACGLTLAYDGRAVLTDVDLTVHAGDVWFLLGPNGAGKSTLLRAVLGMLAPRAGTLRLHPTLAGRATTGFVPQRCELNPTLPTTVREFVVLGTVGLPGGDERARLGWALDHAGLAGMERRDYWSLSGGERQRALVARALVRRPRFLILDEPTNNLDPGAEEALLALLADLRRDEHVTLLIVTHDLRIAARYATHVALVADGTVLAGPRDVVLTQANLTRAFGVSTGATVA
jgi:ABC-type Mn2+/Zn2+ transport system ATPase subunit